MGVKSFKDGKLITIIEEFEVINGTNKYNINGVDLPKAIYFWRSPQGMFENIPLGSYTIEQSGVDTFLVITNTTELANRERIQIGYEFASVSSEYEVDFNVDINILKDNYNKAISDIKMLFEYIKNTMMTADSLDVDVILPQLDTDEVWVKTSDGWRGLNIGNLEENIKDMLKQIDDLKNNIFKEMREAKDRHIAEIDGRFEQEVVEGQGRVTATGNEQVERVTQTGDTKNQLLINTFEEKNTALIQTGTTQNNQLIQTGTTQTGLVTVEGDKQVERVTAQGDIEVQRVIDAGVTGKLDKGGYEGTANDLKVQIDQNKSDLLLKFDKSGGTINGSTFLNNQLIIKDGYAVRFQKKDNSTNIWMLGTMDDKFYAFENGYDVDLRGKIDFINNPEINNQSPYIEFNNGSVQYGYIGFGSSTGIMQIVNRTTGKSLDLHSSGKLRYDGHEIINMSHFNNSQSINGFTRLPSGMIIQKGTITFSRIVQDEQSELTVTLPVSFTSGNDYVVATDVTTAFAPHKINSNHHTKTSTNFKIRCGQNSGGNVSNIVVDWIAIGY